MLGARTPAAQRLPDSGDRGGPQILGLGLPTSAAPGVEFREVGAAGSLPAGMDAPVTPDGCVRTSGNERPRKN